MKLKSITFTNYKIFENAEIDFENDITVIIGKNGAGKSSVLKAASIALSWFISRLKSNSSAGQYIDELSITNGHHQAKLHYVLSNGKTIDIPNKAIKGINKKFELDVECLKEWGNSYRENFEATDFQVSIPVYAFYGVRRAVIDIPLRIRDKEYHLLDTYKDSLSGSANFRDFFTWFRNQEDIENQYKSRNQRVDGLSFTRELDTFRQAMEKFMPGYTDFHVNRNPLRMMVTKGDKKMNVAQMSDGEKIYLALIGDLCHRLVLANPTAVDPLQGEGVVIIDEIDLHLHPEWQGEFALRLHEVFPNIQFIISTHSPHVLNRVPSRCIRSLEGGNPQSKSYSYGIPSEIILKDLMGLSNDLPISVQNTIDGIYKAITEKNLKEARALYQTLYEKVPFQPELVRIRKMIERLQSK